MIWFLIALLAVSLVVNGLGIFFTHKDANAGIDSDDRPYIQTGRTRGVALLGVGLALNTIAGVLSLLTASTPVA